MASNAENVSIWWRHHENLIPVGFYFISMVILPLWSPIHEDITRKRFAHYWLFAKEIPLLLCDLCCSHEEALELTVDLPVMWDAMPVMWCCMYCTMMCVADIRNSSVSGEYAHDTCLPRGDVNDCRLIWTFVQLIRQKYLMINPTEISTIPWWLKKI